MNFDQIPHTTINPQAALLERASLMPTGPQPLAALARNLARPVARGWLPEDYAYAALMVAADRTAMPAHLLLVWLAACAELQQNLAQGRHQ
jgi:hypothetical protein